MKLFRSILLLSLFLILGCRENPALNEQQQNLVKDEIRQFMDEMDADVAIMNEADYANRFLNTDELAVATQGKLLTSYDAIRDTIHVHMSAMQKQEVQNIDEKIFIIDRNHAVISTSKLTHITLKNGAEFTMPYALTIFLVKRNGEWKIAHYHN